MQLEGAHRHTHHCVALAHRPHRHCHRYKSYKFSLVIGADLIPTLPQWRDAKRLVKTVEFVVVARPGYSIPASAQLPPHSTILSFPAMPHRRIASAASSAFGGGGGGSSSSAAAGDGADDDNDAICVGVWEVSSTEVRKALPEGRASGLIQVTHCAASLITRMRQSLSHPIRLLCLFHSYLCCITFSAIDCTTHPPSQSPAQGFAAHTATCSTAEDTD